MWIVRKMSNLGAVGILYLSKRELGPILEEVCCQNVKMQPREMNVVCIVSIVRVCANTLQIETHTP